MFWTLLVTPTQVTTLPPLLIDWFKGDVDLAYAPSGVWTCVPHKVTIGIVLPAVNIKRT